MTTRTIAVVLLALVCGASMAFVFYRNIARGAPVEATSVNTESVVVAVKSLPRFHQMNEGDLTIRRCSKEWVTEDTLTKVEDVIGQITSANLAEGDVLTQGKLINKGGVACLVAPNMRAYAIQTSRATSNVAGFIMPGDKVDVLLNLKGSRGDTTGGGSTTTLLQNIEVLAVADCLDAPEDFKLSTKEMTSVTVHVTPQQVNDLDLGQNLGVLTLSLRNPDDNETAETIATTISDIRFLGGQANSGLPEGMVDEPPVPALMIAPPKQPPAPVWVVTLRGGHRGRVMLSPKQAY